MLLKSLPGSSDLRGKIGEARLASEGRLACNNGSRNSFWVSAGLDMQRPGLLIPCSIPQQLTLFRSVKASEQAGTEGVLWVCSEGHRQSFGDLAGLDARPQGLAPLRIDSGKARLAFSNPAPTAFPSHAMNVSTHDPGLRCRLSPPPLQSSMSAL